ncbi:MAG: MBL fold metallo-hydrolase [Clostridia bacterium]|nr:MBL fold metallo-hydrolase [Clostridia bacterium]
MKAEKISNRGTMFTFRPLDRWDMHSYWIEGKDNHYIIDTACGSLDAQEIKDYVLSHAERKPFVVILTHHHWDHVWGTGCFDAKTIIANKKLIGDMLKYGEYEIKHNIPYIRGKVCVATPTLLVENDLTIAEDNLFLFTSTGHTIDCLCILDGQDRVLYVGDNIGDSIDSPLPHLVTGKSEYINAVEYMKSLDFDILCSGHNRVLDKSFLDKILLALSKKK